MRRAAVADLVGHWMPEWSAQREKADELDRWYRGRNDKPFSPRRAVPEYKHLRDKSVSPWLGLVVTVVAQSLFVDGYRRADAPADSAPWAAWQFNGFDSRQVAVHRAALAHGFSYVTVLPGTDPLTGRAMPVARGHSARRMLAVYADPAADEWPLFALRADAAPGGALSVRVWDEDAVHLVSADTIGGRPEFIESQVHGLGVCPVTRFANQLDLDGRSDGEVEPYIPIAARIDQTTFDRLIVQRFGSWKVRTATGMTEPETDEDKRAAKAMVEVGDVLVGEEGVQFGTLDGTPLDGYVNAKEADVRELSAVSQTPAVDLLGLIPNLAAEALEEARASAARKSAERKMGFGESHEQWLRLSGRVMGDLDAAVDYESQVIWRDVESRSLGQVADALGKLAQMLAVPVEVLWEKIPGWTQTDVERAKALAAQARDADASAQAKAFGLTGSAAPPDAPAGP